MARATHVAADTTEVQAYTGSGCLVGVTILAGGAAATVRIYDGADEAGTLVAVAGAPADTSVYLPVPPTNFTTGLYVKRDTSSEVVLYLF